LNLNAPEKRGNMTRTQRRHPQKTRENHWDSLESGTFTKSGTNPLPVYGINRAKRREMARVLKTKWATFMVMLMQNPSVVLKAYQAKIDETAASKT
jgi:hypothetical protein